jgi:hypothetical protein
MLASAFLGCLRPRTIAFAAGFIASALAVLPLSPASAQDLIVKFDQSTLLRMPRPVAEVIIGNPLIVDVTVQSNDMLVVTGKTFGITNIIALDATRNIIQDQRVLVMRDEARMVSVTKGGRRESYNCSPNCNPSFMPGDEAVYFEAVGKSFERKNKMSESAADQGQSGAQ